MSRLASGLVAAAAAGLLASAPARAQTLAVVGGTVHPVAWPAIENATVLIQDGKIVAVGRDVAIPADARRVDARGKVVTPGLLHAASNLGVLEVSSIASTNETDVTGDVTPSFDVARGINPDNVRIPVARLEGVTSAIVLPGGGFVAGQAAWIGLLGDDPGALVRARGVALLANLGPAAKGAGDGARARGLARLERLLDDAAEYDRRRDDYRRNAIQPLSAPADELEALLPVLRGERPLLVAANSERDIRNALQLATARRLRLVLLGGAEGWKVAGELERARVPVAVNAFANIPGFDNLGARWDNAALLDEAGVAVILYEAESGGPRNLRWAAGHTVRNGLPWARALEAVTAAPARAFGLADGTGTLVPGAVADLVVWSGDPFEYATRAELVLVGGREVPRTSRQTDLLERYRRVPLQ
ncbi:MAG TPA: amidohydrolase family protein [Gemmatimonadales bacterium]|nr:amidohydrolase family protein [Gemmatimonadales bacterium]